MEGLFGKLPDYPDDTQSQEETQVWRAINHNKNRAQPSIAKPLLHTQLFTSTHQTLTNHPCSKIQNFIPPSSFYQSQSKSSQNKQHIQRQCRLIQKVKVDTTKEILKSMKYAKEKAKKMKKQREKKDVQEEEMIIKKKAYYQMQLYEHIKNLLKHKKIPPTLTTQNLDYLHKQISNDFKLEQIKKSYFVNLLAQKEGFIRRINTALLDIKKQDTVENKKRQGEVRKEKIKQRKKKMQRIDSQYRNNIEQMRDKLKEIKKQNHVAKVEQYQMLSSLKKELKQNKTQLGNRKIGQIKNQFNFVI